MHIILYTICNRDTFMCIQQKSSKVLYLLFVLCPHHLLAIHIKTSIIWFALSIFHSMAMICQGVGFGKKLFLCIYFHHHIIENASWLNMGTCKYLTNDLSSVIYVPCEPYQNLLQLKCSLSSWRLYQPFLLIISRLQES